MTCFSNDVWYGAGAEAGEQVLKQQEQLAALARRQRRQATTTRHASQNITAISQASNQATDSVADEVRLEVSAHSSFPLWIHWRVCPSSSLLALLPVGHQSCSIASTSKLALFCAIASDGLKCRTLLCTALDTFNIITPPFLAAGK